MRVVALLSCYTGDVEMLPWCLQWLEKEGVEFYFIDNWSEDGCWEMLDKSKFPGLIGKERYPIDGPTDLAPWQGLLRRKERMAEQIEADWFVNTDIDEVREGPWLDVGLIDSIARVDKDGFNRINHLWLEFRPDRDVPDDKNPHDEILRYYVPGTFHCQDPVGGTSGKFILESSQRKIWKNLKRPVRFYPDGHTVNFEGALDYPLLFVLRHYPYRTKKQFLRKMKIRENRSPKEFAGDYIGIDWKRALEEGMEAKGWAKETWDKQKFKKWLLKASSIKMTMLPGETT